MGKPIQATILVVVDSSMSRAHIVSILQDAGYLVLVAEDGEQAIAVSRQKLPDLILTNIVLAHMDGYEICAAMQHDSTLSAVPVIIMSMRQGLAAKTKAFEFGAVDYIIEPFAKEEILARIKTHLKISHLSRSLRESNKQLLQQQQILLNNLRAAAEVQRNLLPSHIPSYQDIKFAAYFEPSQTVGGDLYNIIWRNESELDLYIIDVSGHGASAAMMTAMISQSLSPDSFLNRQIAMERKNYQPGPVEIFGALNKEFPMERFNLYFTLFYFRLNRTTRHYTYSSAGHPPALLQKNDDSFLALEEGGPVIGMGELAMHWKQGEGQLEAGDRLFFFTDGIIEYPNQQDELYGTERLQQSLATGKGKNLDDTLQRAIADMKRYGGNRHPPDDITMVAMECQ